MTMREEQFKALGAYCDSMRLFMELIEDEGDIQKKIDEIRELKNTLRQERNGLSFCTSAVESGVRRLKGMIELGGRECLVYLQELTYRARELELMRDRTEVTADRLKLAKTELNHMWQRRRDKRLSLRASEGRLFDMIKPANGEGDSGDRDLLAGCETAGYSEPFMAL